MTNSGLRRFVAYGLRCLILEEYESGARTIGLDQPSSFDLALAEAERCAGGRGENYLLSCPSWTQRVRIRPLRHGGWLGHWSGDRYFTSRRSERELRNWRILETKGAPIPGIVLAASRRRGIFWTPYLGTVNLEKAMSVFEWLSAENHSFASLQTVALALARSIRAFHDAGGVHGDLHLGNLLIDDSGDQTQCWLVDLDHSTLKDDPTASDRMRDLMRLWRSIEKADDLVSLDPRIRACFFAAYCGPDRQLRRALIARFDTEKRRLIRHRIAWQFRGGLERCARSIGITI